MKGKVLLFFALYIFWTILSERFTIESFSLGLVVVLLILFFNRDEQSDGVENEVKIRKPLLFIKVGILLLKEIVLSNIDVAKIVLSKNLIIQPQLFEYETSLKSEKLRVLFANTITITPGTITVSLDGNKLLIHALRDENISGVTESKIEKLLLDIERD